MRPSTLNGPHYLKERGDVINVMSHTCVGSTMKASGKRGGFINARLDMGLAQRKVPECWGYLKKNNKTKKVNVKIEKYIYPHNEEWHC